MARDIPTKHNPLHGEGLADAAAQPVDLLVIGGGIVGVGIARDAAMRGLRVVLAEARDLGWGTSSRSSRLIHGGIRYLEHAQFRLVSEALRERAVLRHIAPHLVWPLPFVFPLFRGDRVPLWKLAAGLWFYDLLAGRRKLERHRRLTQRELLELEPGLRSTGLEGGGRYVDMQCDDARLVVATARSAAAHGAHILNHTPVESLLLEGGRVRGAVLHDRVMGTRGTVRARIVVSAAGPWTDELRRLEDADTEPVLRTTKGAHLVVPRGRLGNNQAVTFLSPVDGRVMFALPWSEHWSYIGTTDTDEGGEPDAVHTSAADVEYLLRSVNAVFPSAHLQNEDVLATWAGLRPLVRDGAVNTSSVSREHAILEGTGGMLAVAGGKLTTYRPMAADVVDRVVERLRGSKVESQKSTVEDRATGKRWPHSAPTDKEPLPGGESAELTPIGNLAREVLDEPTVKHLLRHYGTETASMANLVRAHPKLARPLHPAHPAIAAEVVHHVRREFARAVDDVLVRRIHLFYETADQGAAAAPAVAQVMGQELGWTSTQERDEVAAYEAGTGR